MFRVFVIALVLGLGACSLNLGAEKLQLDAKTAKSAPGSTAPPSVTSAREDGLRIRKVFA